MEKPILFNTAMVKAILNGKKTCTRRILKGNINGLDLIGTGSSKCNDTFDMMLFGKLDKEKVWNSAVKERAKVPFMPGDILYIRETWLKADDKQYYYRADETTVSKEAREDFGYKWKPSIHMPKEAARIFLEVIAVHAERLQDITEDGARKEGIREYTKDGNLFKYAASEEQYKWSQMPRNPIEPFKSLWDSTVNKKDIGKYCWDANPWVWVIKFKVKEVKR